MISLTFCVVLEQSGWIHTFNGCIEMTYHNGSKGAVTIYPVNDPWTKKDLLNLKPLHSNILKNKQTNFPMLCWSTQKFPPLLTGSASIFVLVVLSTLASEVLEGLKNEKIF